jgi:A/G-specific adenine glycosylase
MLRWFGSHGRRFPWRETSATVYERVVTEVLLQRTRAEVVAAFWPSFAERFPLWTSLARADLVELENALRPLGLYRRRARSLSSLAKWVLSHDDQFPSDRATLEQIPAVGQYVASAIILFAHGDSAPLLDTNMARVLERYFGSRELADIRYDPYLQRLSSRVVVHSRTVHLNWAILDLGATICRSRRPVCADCPLSGHCRSASSRRRATFRVRPP